MADLSTSTGPLQGSSTHFIGSSANHYTGTGSELPWDTPSQSLGVSADGLSPTPYNSSRDYYHVYTGEDPGRPHTILHRLLSTPSELHTYDSMYENGTSGWALNHTQGLLGNASLSSEPSPSGLAGDISLGVLLGALSMLTFVGNAMVLHAVRTEKRLQTVSNMFIVSLAIADLIVGLIVMPISAAYIFTKDWIFGVVVCQFWIGIDYTASTASILNLFILSLDRYWSVTSPLQYLRKRTKKRAMLMISFVWFLSSLWLIPIIGWHHFEHNGVRTVPNNVCDTEYATNTVLKIITAIMNFYLPLAIMFALYGKIFMEIRKRSNMELGQRNVGGGSYRGPPPTTAITTAAASFTDESPRSGQEEEGVNRARYSQVPSKHLLHSPLLRMPTDYETDTSEDTSELRRLTGDGYTNLTLVQMSLNEGTGSSEVPTSDTDTRMEYLYDETVLDSTTERVHRFYEEHPMAVFKGAPEPTSAEESTDSAANRNNDNHGKLWHPKNRALMGIIGNNKRSTDLLPRRSFKHIRSNPPRRKRRGSAIPGLIEFRRSAKNKLALEEAMRRHGKPAPRPKPKQGLDKPMRRGGRNSDKNVPKKRPSAALAREIKAARQLGVIMGAFTICFCPYFVLFMVVAFCDGCVSASLMTAMTWIGYMNSTLNPVLYPACNHHFRRKFRKMLGLSNLVGREQSPKSLASNVGRSSINGYRK